MKTVYMADDGTIFKTEEACEKYEDNLLDFKSLQEAILVEFFSDDCETWFEITRRLATTKSSVLIRFIKSIGEQDAN